MLESARHVQEHDRPCTVGVAAPVLDQGGVVDEVAEIVAGIGGDAEVFILDDSLLLVLCRTYSRPQRPKRGGGRGFVCTARSTFHPRKTSSELKPVGNLGGAPYVFFQNESPSMVSPFTSPRL